MPETIVTNEIMNLPLKMILMDQNLNCRGDIAPMDVNELAKDIQKNGLLSPVIVQKFEKDHLGVLYPWRLIAGFRRFTAHKVLGVKTIRCVISGVNNDKDARVINLRENLLRKDLNMMEEAQAVQHLRGFDMTMQEIAAELGKSFSWVQIRMYLLELPQEIQTQAAVGIITQHQIRDLKNLPTKEMQFEAVKQIVVAKEKGERSPIIRPKKSESALTKRLRKKSEIFVMMDHIQESVGNNFGTRCLAWTAGEITDNAIYQEIRAIANKMDRPYIIPNESVMSRVGIDVNAERT